MKNIHPISSCRLPTKLVLLSIGLAVACSDLVVSVSPAKTYLSEDFESVALGDSVDEGVPGTGVWTKTPPDGWTIDDSGMAGIGDGLGVTEWRGWSFATREWWATTAEDQGRSDFLLGTGTVAIADPDEWDDAGSPSSQGTFNSFLSRRIEIEDASAASLVLEFDSSFRPEGAQKASVTVTFDDGEPVTVIEWVSVPDDKTNEHVAVELDNPAGASEMTLTFGMTDAGNNWFWAIDNIVVRSNTLFSEDFESITLEDSVDEANFGEGVWSSEPPIGWVVDRSEVPGFDEDGIGVTEWKGWNFADKDWWASVDDQRRSEFERAEGTVAVADPDEWDDLGSPSGLGTFNSFLTSPEIPISGVDPGSITLAFDSAFRPEGNQKASLTVSYDGGEPLTLFEWVSVPDNKTNESVIIQLDNPAGASTMQLVWGMTEAGNNWYWAIDNIVVTTAPLPVNVTGLEAVVNDETKEVTLTWAAAANIPDGAVEVLRDGTVIAELPLSATTYTDMPPGADNPEGLVANYSVRVKDAPDGFDAIGLAVAVTIPMATKIAEWRLDETGGTVAADEFGEFDGAYFIDRDFPADGEEPSWEDADPYGGGADFLGPYFDLGDFEATEALRPPLAVTVAAWVKPSDLVNWAGIFNLAFDSGSEEAGYYLGTRDGADFHFAVTTESRGNLHYHRAPGEFDTWQHVVGTYDGSAIHLYINGEETVEPAEASGPILYETNSGFTPLGAQIGTFLDDNEFISFAGVIAHVELWNGALSSAQVKELYELNSQGIFPGAGGLGLRIVSVDRDDERGEVTLTWTSASGRTYAISSSDDLEEWLEVDDGVESAGETTSFTDTVPEGTTERYYRVEELR